MSGFFIEIFKFNLIYFVLVNAIIYIFNNLETKNMDDIIEKCLLIKSRL